MRQSNRRNGVPNAGKKIRDRSPTWVPRYIAIIYMQRTQLRPIDCWFSLFGSLWIFLISWFCALCPWPLWLLLSFISLFHRIPGAPPDVWLWTFASAPISCWVCCWMKPLCRWLCYVPVYKYSRFSPRAVGYLTLGSWLPRHCGAWVSPCSMGFNLDQSLAGHTYKYCVTFTPACPASRTNCRLRVLWLHWCPSHSNEALPGYRRWLVQLHVPYY